MMTALILLSNLASSILRAFSFKLINHNQISKINHINFFKLGRCAKFTCHHIHRNIANLCNLSIPLPDSTRFNNDKIKPGCFNNVIASLIARDNSLFERLVAKTPHIYTR